MRQPAAQDPAQPGAGGVLPGQRETVRSGPYIKQWRKSDDPRLETKRAPFVVSGACLGDRRLQQLVDKLTPARTQVSRQMQREVLEKPRVL